MTITVALIEDNPHFRQRFERVVRGAGDMALRGVAVDFASGLALLDGAAVDVLLVDLGLPGGNGVDLIRLAMQRWLHCDAMVVTVFGDENNVMSALRAGATGYLLKDVDDATLLTEIRSLHQGGSPISPVIARQVLKLLQPLMPPVTPSAVKSPDTVLTSREQEVLALTAKGYSFKEVAKQIEVSDHTVNTHVKNIYRKLQATSKNQALTTARRLGLIDE